MTKLKPRSSLDTAAMKATLRTVLIYLVFAIGWIALSDRLSFYIVPDADGHLFYGTLKGALFVVISGIMIYILLYRALSAGNRAQMERAQLLVREQSARARAEAASRAKDDLLAVVSHELRTPLTAILTSAEVLEQDPSLSDENRELAEMIRENVLQESRIVADLLDCSSLASGKLELRLARVDLHQSLAEAILDQRAEAAAKNIHITQHLAANPSFVRADPMRVQQVLRNLLSNAIKFTPKSGSVTISTTNAGSTIAMEISDTGIGMSPELCKRLFEPFEQGDNSITRRFGGLGLGLYLAKSIIRMHGGTLQGTSPGVGKGSTFRFELPVWTDQDHETKLDEPAQLKCEGMIVMLVDDNVDTLRALGRLLGRMGCTVMAARSGQQALQTAAREKIDLIICDIGLPDMSGWEVMRQINARQPVYGIAFSGFDSDEDRQRSQQAGFQQHLVKPVNFPVLQAAILKAANARTAEAAS